MYVYYFPCDYFSPLYVVIRMCFGKQIRNYTIRVLPYVCVQRSSSFSLSLLLLLLLSYLLFFLCLSLSLLILKHPTNVHCDWCVSSSSLRSLSCCCLMMFYVCKYVRACVWDIVFKRDRVPSFFFGQMNERKKNKIKEKEMVICQTTHISIDQYTHAERNTNDEHRSSEFEVNTCVAFEYIDL